MSTKKRAVNLVLPLGCSSYLFAMTFVVFLILKLFKIIKWSWWWVTAPLWIGSIGHVLLLAFAWIYTMYICKEGASTAAIISDDIKMYHDRE